MDGRLIVSGPPRVSVVMSAWNAGKGAREAINSVLDQDFADFEVIVIDDCSSDDTRAILEEAARLDARVRVLFNEENLGLTRSLIRGVEEARGAYIARIDAGDTWLPEKLGRQVDYLDTHPDCILCGTQVAYFSGGHPTGTSSFVRDDAALRLRLFTRESLLSHPTILFRRGLNYRAAFRMSQDLDLYARAAFSGTLHCLPEPLVRVAVGDDGLTVNGKFLQRQYQYHGYRLFLDRFATGSDALERNPEQPLPIRSSAWEKRLCGLAVFFFRRYMRHKLRKSPLPVWLFFFAASLLLYPPFLKDYALRLWLIRKYRRSPWEGRVIPQFVTPAKAAARTESA